MIAADVIASPADAWIALGISGMVTLLVTIIGARRGAAATMAETVDNRLKLLIEVQAQTIAQLQAHVAELEARIRELEKQIGARP